ncbi:Cochaperone prefoldin complex subunit [Coemansia spiralis]|uniref:Cochaperone prefoldin complex subunit n=2 Tax=Coemansia TaxID=4863 RepID=A0A9W8G678_9FUNG|nr:Prefoldin beta-like protein [Coemansia spiralis]KAJ1995535.1 Cochaperone prefoldin complex subunit [Coemansia umbellata]KAJ2625133.1 Cochaperone prefoldin complex subunit [Coemansia sp. RSA 1358]KAJ2679914.1 Cochaperone prefoldin complex subunit [Coemansia spiralis]
MSSSSAKKPANTPNEQELRVLANQFSGELKAIASKIGELELQLDEHNLVIKTMTPMPEERKCFRLINGVLVERTVKEVLPALKTNRDGISSTITQLTNQYKSKDKEFSDFQKQHHIRIASA